LLCGKRGDTLGRHEEQGPNGKNHKKGQRPHDPKDPTHLLTTIFLQSLPDIAVAGRVFPMGAQGSACV
jgi:hypothetical protein